VLPRLALPPIHLSNQHEATCVVKQGDALPDFELQDAEGKSHRLSSLFGDRLTAVCFWSGKSPAAVQQLQDMGPEILDAFAKQGLAVIAINYGQSAAAAKRVAEQTGFTSPLLLDPQGAAFSQVATRHLPRTYLLDREGKVVWFDLEYSPSTRRHLRQAIEYTLSQP
jgi:peroxiredoxin